MLRESSNNLFINDEQIVGLITYIRNTWDNTGLATEEKVVRRVRESTLDLQYPWREAETAELYRQAWLRSKYIEGTSLSPPQRGASLPSPQWVAHFTVVLLPYLEQFSEAVGLGGGEVIFFGKIFREIVEFPFRLARGEFSAHSNQLPIAVPQRRPSLVVDGPQVRPKVHQAPHDRQAACLRFCPIVARAVESEIGEGSRIINPTFRLRLPKSKPPPAVFNAGFVTGLLQIHRALESKDYETRRSRC